MALTFPWNRRGNCRPCFIAHLIQAYLCAPIRTISIVIGEGGSGGALALQVADRRAAMEDSLYATAPPESLAAIIFRDPNRIEQALAISKSRAKDLKYFKVIDTIIPQAKKVDDVRGHGPQHQGLPGKGSPGIYARSALTG